MTDFKAVDIFRLFSDYLKVTGVAHTGPEPEGDPELIGKRLGLINGSSGLHSGPTFLAANFYPAST